jgi:hypothetical protein
LFVTILHDETSLAFFDRPGRREAAIGLDRPDALLGTSALNGSLSDALSNAT